MPVKIIARRGDLAAVGPVAGPIAAERFVEIRVTLAVADGRARVARRVRGGLPIVRSARRPRRAPYFLPPHHDGGVRLVMVAEGAAGFRAALADDQEARGPRRRDGLDRLEPCRISPKGAFCSMAWRCARLRLNGRSLRRSMASGAKGQRTAPSASAASARHHCSPRLYYGGSRPRPSASTTRIMNRSGPRSRRRLRKATRPPRASRPSTPRARPSSRRTAASRLY